MPDEASVGRPVLRVAGEARVEADDRLAVEEPLEIRVIAEGVRQSVAVTMRTPGHDLELAVGFLFSEGAVLDASHVLAAEHCPGARGEARGNVVNVSISPEAGFDARRFTRNVYTTSSCGVCGKTSLELVRTTCPSNPRGSRGWSREILESLPDRLREAQPAFEATGGLHAAALVDPAGALRLVREDVGRHNALDKIVGRLVMDDRIPGSDLGILVSGRASYELVQKTVMAGIPLLAAVGAPTSLAVSLAEEYGVTLIGFLRDGRFNVYSARERVS